jgi:predicted alternative tryptophan synthase beta-subunit
MAAASITSAVALAYFGIGEGVNHFCRRSQTGWGLGISMASTVFRLLGIAGLLWWMGRSGVFDDAAQRLGMAVAVAVAVAARAAGECLGEIRRRVPAIDYQPPADWMERA